MHLMDTVNPAGKKLHDFSFSFLTSNKMNGLPKAPQNWLRLQR